MLYELEAEKYSSVAPLFELMNDHLAISSILNSDSPARIYVVDPSHPQSALVTTRRRFYLAGAENNAAFDAGVAAHIIEMLGYGQLTIAEWKPADRLPPYDLVMETLADMMDRSLAPKGGGNSQAGKVVIRRVVARAIAQLEQAKKEKDKQKDNAPQRRGQPSGGVRK